MAKKTRGMTRTVAWLIVYGESVKVEAAIYYRTAVLVGAPSSLLPSPFLDPAGIQY
jgi:hypothetical protein